jgi:hypothetical protein
MVFDGIGKIKNCGTRFSSSKIFSPAVPSHFPHASSRPAKHQKRSRTDFQVFCPGQLHDAIAVGEGNWRRKTMNYLLN